jgi:hypothetical protein
VQRPDEQFIDPEHAADLDRSKKIFGEKVPIVIDDRTGRTVDGRHRLQHGWKLERHIRTKDDLEFWELRLAYSVQRTIGESEKVDIFSHLGDELEKKGLSDPEIVKQLLELSHYKKSETYEMIPDRFKGDQGPKGPNFHRPESLQEGSSFAVDGEEVGVRGPDEELRPKHPVGPCPCCDPPKIIAYVGGRFRLADAQG